MKKTLLGLVAAAVIVAAPAAQAEERKLLNVSYDIARELFAAINPAFIADWKEKTGQEINIDQSHAGTSKQARAILEGLPADVVTFNQTTDIDVLHQKGDLIPANWQQLLPNNASPWYSLPAFLVRAGNPKGIKDWDDLAKDDVKIVFPNPKTSGNARYTYLAATAFAQEKFPNDPQAQHDFVKTIFANVPVFDTGGRGSTTTFVERGIGDVLITFEAEVNNIRRQFGEDKYEVVIPSVSLLAEFPVAVVQKVAEKNGNADLAKGYLDFLYSPAAQDIVAKNFHRVHHPDVAAKYAAQFPDVRLVTVEETFGGWTKVQEEHFAEGALLDQAFVKR